MSKSIVPIDTVTDYGTREAWLAARKSGVGGSESAALFGVSKFMTKHELWLRKTGRLPDWQPDPETAERLEWGQILEGPIAEAYAKRSARVIWGGPTNGGLTPYCIAQHPRLGCMFATPDRFIIEAPDRRARGEVEAGALQIKNTANVYHSDSWRDGVPLYVQVQVQQEMACTGREYNTVATLANGNRLLTWDVERNEDFITELEHQVEDFWESVLADREPPIEPHPRSLEVIKRLHPLDNGKLITLPAEATRLWRRYRLFKAIEKKAHDRAEHLEAQLRALIGPNSFAELDNGELLSLKAQSRKGYTNVVGPTTYRTLSPASKADRLLIAADKTKGKAA